MRKRLAAAEGFDLDSMRGFDGDREWADVRSDLLPLLNHSDSEGWLLPEGIGEAPERLIAIVVEWPDDDYDRTPALKLAQAMQEARAERLPLRFG